MTAGETTSEETKENQKQLEQQQTTKTTEAEKDDVAMEITDESKNGTSTEAVKNEEEEKTNSISANNVVDDKQVKVETKDDAAGQKSSDRSTSEDNNNITTGAAAATTATEATATAATTTATNDNTTTSNNDNNNNNNNDRHWDLTNRKVTIHNVMKYVTPRNVNKWSKKWLEDLQKDHPSITKFTKVKKPPRDNWIQVTMENEDQVQIMIDYINNNNITNKKGGKLYATRVDDKKKRKRMMEDSNRDGEEGENKRQRFNNNDGNDTNRRPLIMKDLRDVVTPLWKQSYEEQLKIKTRNMIKKCTMKIVQEVKQRFRLIHREAKRNTNRKAVKEYDWLLEKRPIVVNDIIPAPGMIRNKCEFTFGYRCPSDINTTTTDDKERQQTKDEEDNKEKKETTNSNDNDDDKMQEVKEVKEEQKEEENNNKNKDDKDCDDKMQEDNNIDENKTKEDDQRDKQHQEQQQQQPKLPAVGFMASGWSGGVSRPHACQNIPDEACALVDIVDSFLQTTPLPPYDSKIHRGFWRFLTTRTSKRTGECMVVICHAPPSGGVGKKDETDDYSKIFESEKQRLVSLLTEKELKLTEKREFPIDETFEKLQTKKEEEDKPIFVTSIFFQEFNGLSNPNSEVPVQHAFGKTALQEKLGKCTFQISPGAFFQVNTPGAENLYNVVVEKLKEVAKDPTETLLYDVCCGTGTIGITCMKEGITGQVIGVDISGPAIEDAKYNAKLNGYSPDDDNNDDSSSPSKVKKTRFIAARAEHVLTKELTVNSKGTTKTVVAVVDPARDGLHADVIRSLRNAREIQRVVYVSCNPTGSLVRDCGLLCAPPTKKYGGIPFQPTSAQPVDMFPLTDHCELVVTFDRMSED